ncbi:MAG: ArsB/NhaD family transporter [Nitrospiraceae bacterium]|nr:ArsB/NhaD family transporter [Nitrospiraceae bacterium]
MDDVTLALLIFIAAYLAIISERIHKTIVALLGASLMIVSGVLTQEEAFHSPEHGVDYNVVFLLIAMMVIINIVRKTGLFEWLAVWAAKRTQARPFPMMALLCTITAVLSAFLDNVTTVLLMAPVTLELAKRLQVEPVPFLVGEALSSNIGGTATLVGDPPNIMIASKASLGYLDFLVMLGPVTIVIFVLFLLAIWIFSGRGMKVSPELQAQVLALDEGETIRDARLLRTSLWLLGLTTVGFCFHGVLHVEPATIALLSASIFMVAGHGRGSNSGEAELDYLTEVEWKTIFFFIGLFILVGGLVKTGVIGLLAKQLIVLTKGSEVGTAMAVLWGSAIISAIVDNIPYVAAMNPLIIDLARSLHPSISDPVALVHQPDIVPLWWALALGACLGGNGTVIGASANVIIVDLARRAGYHISFGRFMLMGVPVMLGSMVVSTLYLWLLFFR